MCAHSAPQLARARNDSGDTRREVGETDGRAVLEDLLKVVDLVREDAKRRRRASVVDGRFRAVEKLSALPEAVESAAQYTVHCGKYASDDDDEGDWKDGVRDR